MRRAPQRLQRGLFVINPFQGFGGTPVDSSFASVQVLLHFNASGTTITDVKGGSWTCQGNATQSTSSPLRGSGSLLLDGTGDEINSNQTNSVGTGQFTLEAMIRPSIAQVGRVISAQDSVASNEVLAMRVNANGSVTSIIRNAAGAGTQVLTSSAGLVAMNDSQTYHLALTRDGSNLVNLWLDGTSVASGTSATNCGASGRFWCVGAFSNNSEYFGGKIDEVRITPGVCRYTGTFTPPASEHPNA